MRCLCCGSFGAEITGRAPNFGVPFLETVAVSSLWHLQTSRVLALEELAQSSESMKPQRYEHM